MGRYPQKGRLARNSAPSHQFASNLPFRNDSMSMFGDQPILRTEPNPRYNHCLAITFVKSHRVKLPNAAALN